MAPGAKLIPTDRRETEAFPRRAPPHLGRETLTMNELSSVLRDVLRALGVDEWQRVGLAHGTNELACDHGDLHERAQPQEFTRA